MKAKEDLHKEIGLLKANVQHLQNSIKNLKWKSIRDQNIIL